MTKRAIQFLSLLAATTSCFAQQAIDQYIRNQGDYNDVVQAAAASRTDMQVKRILPARLSMRFVQYAAIKNDAISKQLAENLLADTEKLLMNKQAGSPSGASGITNVVSHVAAPALIGVGVEYGNILQNTTGNTTTLRANLLGVSRLLLGAQQFPYCPVINQPGCTPASRWLRRFSGVAAFENTNNNTAAGAASIPTSTTPVSVNLFGNGFRMASWGARFDITHNDPHDPKFVSRFPGIIAQLRTNAASQALAVAASQLFSDASTGAVDPAFTQWEGTAIAALKAAATPDEFKHTLETQLDALIPIMMNAHQDFPTRVATLMKASENYFAQRDALLQTIQTHQFSLEYTNQHPQNQPSTSNVRLIYSHQPSVAPTLITFNAAVTWYNSLPAAPAATRLRDVQASGQVERRLGVIPNLGNAVATFAGYYQWMKEDALITIGPGNVAPGSGIVLPDTAAKLLGTKGNIGVVQGRLTLPLNSTLKIPISVTWSNRTELIKESDVRGQVGITLDVDNLFK